MPTTRITKVFSFEMAHSLWNHSGKCKNIHGHSYKLFVCLNGQIRNSTKHPEDGMIIDFGKLKSLVEKFIINEFDHALVINSKSTEEDTNILNLSKLNNVKYVDFQPTSENLINHFAEILKKQLPENIYLYSLKLQETETSFVEWFEQT